MHRSFWSTAVAACLVACTALELEPPDTRGAGAGRAGGESEEGPARPAPHVVREIEGEPLYGVLSKDAIPSIDESRFVSAQEAQAFMQPDEPVLGVVGAHGTARAYSAWHLDRHEIVNDRIDGEPIAVTW